jgi:hypothetical protein
MRIIDYVRVKTAVVVSKAALEEVEGILRSILAKTPPPREGSFLQPKISYTGNLIDDARVEFASMAELLAYSNRRDRRLASLDISTSNIEPQVQVTFWGIFEQPFQAQIRGEEPDTLATRERFVDVAHRVRAPYRWMYWEWFYILLGATGGLYVAMVAYGIWAYLAGRLDPSAPSSSSGGFWSIIFGVSAAASLAALAAARHWLYPRVVFEIGQEAIRNDRLKAVRKWIVVTLCLGLVVSIFAKQLMTWIGIH